MSWSPEKDLNVELKLTFDQYEQQDNYGTKSLRPGTAKLDVNEDIYDDLDNTSTLRPDIRAELALANYRRTLGYPANDKRTWSEQHPKEPEDTLEKEIMHIARRHGPEVNSSKLNSKTTSRNVVSPDSFPIIGLRNQYVNVDHFKFPNPYVQSPPAVDGNSSGRRTPEGAADDKVAKGKVYVTPGELYDMKSRRNR